MALAGAAARLSRAVWATALALASAAASAQSESALPTRNLLVEVRQGDEMEGSQQAWGAEAGVSASTQKRMQGGVEVRTTRRTLIQRGDLAQQVLVLNGARASVQVGRSGTAVRRARRVGPWARHGGRRASGRVRAIEEAT